LTPTRRNAAARLQGKTLPGGWLVVELLEQSIDATGGHFSTGYLVQNQDGRKGFLKALDYSEAFYSTSKPISIALQELTESINFEKYVLARCRDRRLDRVVISIADGTITDGAAGIDTVEYLIFELADGDVRKHMNAVGNLDVLWRLKTLHHIATGLVQLHTNGIIHQDLKPSNVLVFNGILSKLADFGRAACTGQAPPHHHTPFPGDLAYAPPDILYNFPLDDQQQRRLSFDAYLLGSMVVYFFTTQAMTPLLLSQLPPALADWEHFGGSTGDIKLYLQDAFTRVMETFSTHVPNDIRKELVTVAQQLCEPDPARRGHPGERRGTPSQFSLIRYRTLFDMLLYRAQRGLFRA
jgi:serine/threonine protein kinase